MQPSLVWEKMGKGNRMKTAIITGITGMDGSYLSDLLLEKGYRVIGISRRTSTSNTKNIRHILNHPNFILESGDITDTHSISTIFKKYSPNIDEVYNLAAQSHVKESFNSPGLTWDITGKGCLNVLNSMKENGLISTPFYQASSSEMFGKNFDVSPCGDMYQDENTKLLPQSPYAIAKCAAHHITRLYREAYGAHASCGILFNHEGPRRGEEFVTRKITKWIGEFYKWTKKTGIDPNVLVQTSDDILYGSGHPESFPKLRLGNLNAYRDWGYAPDYCIDYDVPLLTTDGWKFRDNLSIGDEIINFNPKTSALETDVIEEIYDTDSDGVRYHFKGVSVNFSCTANHRIYYQQKSKKSKGGWSDWKVCSAKDLYDKFKNLVDRTKYDYRFPGFFKNECGEYDIEDDKIYLLGILLSEGCMTNRSRSLEISISQSLIANERVHSKIQKTIDGLSLTYSLRKRNDGVVEWRFNVDSSKEILDWFDKPNVHIMPRYVYKFSQRQANILFSALMDGDGCWGSMSYSSKRHLLLMDFQSVANLAGYRTGKVGDCTINVIAKRKKYNYIQEVRKTTDENKNVWCVKTKNKTIITRDNECSFISGNCEAMWLITQQTHADDYVICTGQTHTIRELLSAAFEYIGIKDWSNYIVIDPKFYRPAEVDYLRGENIKARTKLGWWPKTSFSELVKRMVENDIQT